MLKWLWLGIFGVALLVPAALYWAWIWIADPVQRNDLGVAFQRLAFVPLGQTAVETGLQITATIPKESSWMRVLDSWGDPGYFIGVVGPSRHIDCLLDIGAHIEAHIEDQPVALKAVGAPYGYSTDCRPAGLSFQARPGSVVTIHLKVERLPRRHSHLIVEPHWTVGTKDRLVGIAIEEQLHLRTVTIAMGGTGIGLTLIAVLLFTRRPGARGHPQSIRDGIL